ncbi:MAG: hypothetical protein SFW35_01880 [Chitinophagales bacterium]|nr:hypothetical protein [Chitinophagales bacterium]
MSKYLSKSALKALNRIGDLMIPANGEFPSFSSLGGLEHIDEFVGYAPADDIKDLSMVLSILSWMPTFVLRWLIRKMETAPTNEGPLGPIFRQLDVGLKGIIYSCYYGGRPGNNYKGKDPLEIIGFELVRVID